MDMYAVIMAGGKGTRLRPFSIVLPKPLVPLGEQPILQVLLKRLKGHGVHNVTLAVNHFAELIQAFFQNGEKLGMSIKYSTEEKPLSTIGPLKLMEDQLPETFLVMNGDLLTDIDFVDFMAFHRRHEGEVTVAVYGRRVQVDYGVMHLDDHGRLVDFEEKPNREVQVSMGVYAIDRSILRLVPHNESFGFDDLMNVMLAQKLPVHTYQHTGFWLDIGRPNDYEHAQSIWEATPERFQA
ncbi:MAG: sugar phosphate nucleotidyltransferase [Myxococcota bacterium]|nr:sugar phosphate nucleotidyltransferase [Myxococcota bacterium]